MSERSMDGTSTVRIGAIGLNEQRDGNFWGKGPVGVEMLVAKIPTSPQQAPEWMATIERLEESIIAGIGATPHDAAAAAHAELDDLFETLAAILGVEV